MCEDPRTTQTDAEWDALRDAEIAERLAILADVPSIPASDPENTQQPEPILDPASHSNITNVRESIPFTPNYDLTGNWGGGFFVTEARQLGELDFRGIPEEAFQGTWPENPNAYSDYQQGLLRAEKARIERRPAQVVTQNHQTLFDNMPRPESGA